MNYFQLETSLKDSVSPIDQLAFYRKRTEVIRYLEAKIRRTRNAFIKKCHMDSLALIRQDTPESVSWRERAEAAKVNAHLDRWEAL